MHAGAHDAPDAHNTLSVTPLPPLRAPPSALKHAVPLPSLLAHPPSMHVDAHDALDAHSSRNLTPLLGAHGTLTVTPLPPLLAPPAALMHAALLPSLLAPPQSMHADAHDVLDAHGTRDVMPLPPLLAPPPQHAAHSPPPSSSLTSTLSKRRPRRPVLPTTALSSTCSDARDASAVIARSSSVGAR
eukprot:1399976-Rhodomonas_salina.1